MNCKQGDLAVIVRSFARNEGKIVKCVRLATPYECHAACFDGRLLQGPVWVVDRALRGANGTRNPLAYDAQLRPLRDSDGEDEILRITGRPHDAQQAA